MAKVKPVSPARLAAFEVLRRVEEGAYSSVALADQKRGLDQADAALCHQLVMGVLRWQLWLDRLTEYLAGRKVARLDLAVRIALRLGLYQLRLLTRIPASAAVNESVSLVRLARIHSAEGLVNAVLRRATREPQYDPAADIADPVERLAVQTSHPVWLIERWVRRFGQTQTEGFARANNQSAPLAFRVVRNSASEPSVIDTLRSSGARLAASEVSTGAWRVTGAGNLLRQLAREGKVYVQDEASQLVAEIVDARSGERVLDLCAAPGSKATQIADWAQNQALVVAGDLHESRLRTIIGSSRLQRLDSLHCVALNGLETLPFKDLWFDRVLVDAPCSGTGTLRRNPEIRWRISAEDIRNLAGRQLRLLVNGSQMVKPGGLLVYSTCSVEPEENEDVISAFLEGIHSFEPAEVPVKASILTVSGAVRTWPHSEGTDGFFIKALRRKSL